MNRIMSLAMITYREGMRSRALWGVGLFTLFVFGLNVAVAGFFMRDIGKVTIDMNLSGLSVAGLLLVFFIGIHLIGKDIEKKTIHLVLSKPISRLEYVVGKFLGISMFSICSLLLLVVVSVLTILLLMSLYGPYWIGYSWLVYFETIFFLFLKIVVVVSIVVFFSSLTSSSFLVLVFSFCSYLVGISVDEVVFYIRSKEALDETLISESLSRVIDVVSYVLPNLSVFDFSINAAHGIPLQFSQMGVALAYGVLYSGVLLVCSSLIYARREFS